MRGQNLEDVLCGVRMSPQRARLRAALSFSTLRIGVIISAIRKISRRRKTHFSLLGMIRTVIKTLRNS